MLLLAICFFKRFSSFSFLTYINFLLFPWADSLLPIEHAGLSFAMCDIVWAEHTPSARMGLYYPWVSWGGSWGEVSFCAPSLSAPTLLSVSPNPPQPRPDALSLVLELTLCHCTGGCDSAAWFLRVLLTHAFPLRNWPYLYSVPGPGWPAFSCCVFSAFPSSASWPPSVSLLRSLLGSCKLPPVGVTYCAGITT